MKKTLSVILSLVMILGIVASVPFTAQAVEADGQCGENAFYYYSDEGRILNIFGSGDMYDYAEGESPFSGNAAVDSIDIADGITSLGAYAFCNMPLLSELIVPDTVAEINEGAFKNNLCSIDYVGTKGQWETVIKAADFSTVCDCYNVRPEIPLFDVTVSGNVYGESTAVTVKCPENLPTENLPVETTAIFEILDGNGDSVIEYIPVKAESGSDVMTGSITYPDDINEGITDPELLKAPLNAGTNYVVVKYFTTSCTGKYITRTSYRKPFTVAKADPDISVSFEDDDTSASNVFVNIVIPNASGTAVISFDGIDLESIDLVNSKARYSLTGINPHDNMLVVKYSGDSNYNPKEVEVPLSFRYKTSLLDTGDTFEMGMYPQEEVTDSETLAALDSVKCEMHSYGYVQNTNADTHTFDAVDMSYADIMYNGEAYRKVTITEYRPYNTKLLSSATGSQSKYGYEEGKTYYFRWKPIEWKVLAKESDGVYVMSNALLDSQPYHNYDEAIIWKNSSLRTWLNGNFYNDAFSQAEQEKIVSVTHSNEDGNDTTDKLWLLSYGNSTNSAYGFSTDSEAEDFARLAVGTDYAKSQGLVKRDDSVYGSTTFWWISSPGASPNFSRLVNEKGQCKGSTYFCFANIGVRPAFKVKLGTTVGISDPKKANDNFLEISNYDELKAFAEEVNSGRTDIDAVLTADITATDEAWTPIGNDSIKYTGTFDGDGHTITGLTTPENFGDYAGLFGCVGEGGIVQNVGLEGGSINGKYCVGGIVGYNIGTVRNCYNTGVVNGKNYAGGIVGDNYSTVQNCYNTGVVDGERFVGGIVGYNVNRDNRSTDVVNCYNTGAVSGSGTNVVVGGIVGGNIGVLNGSSSVTDCYNTGAVSGSGTDVDVGGIAGYTACATNGSADITDCYNTGAVSGSGTNVDVGGIAGYITCATNGSADITDCYNTGVVSGNNTASLYLGGLIGLIQAGVNGTVNVANCYYDRNVVTVPGATSENNWNAIGKYMGNATVTNVKGLTTAEMTGTDALTNMTGFDDTVWMTKADGNDDADGKYYWFYPHLKGFNYDGNGAQQTGDEISTANWPAKIEASVTWSGSDSYTYNGTEQKPVVSSVTIGGSELTSGADYTVKYQVPTDAGWSDCSECIKAGDYKAVISFTESGHGDIIKEYVIFRATPDITLTVSDTVRIGDNLTITVNYPADADPQALPINCGGLVTIEIDSTDFTVLNGENGVLVVYIPIDRSFELGEHTVKAIFNGDLNGYSTQQETAVFTVLPDTYTISFVNYDGTVLQSGEFNYNETPVYSGMLPEKPADAQYTYTFAGWDKDIEAVTGEATYTATFTPTLRNYTISFVNYNGDVLQSDVLGYGETPVYTGEIPTRETDDSYIYEFDKWDKDIETVKGDKTYTASFREIAIVPFPDVKKDDWFFDAAQYCARNGLITGYENGYFGPADALQRQDFVVILARAAGADLSAYTSCTLPDVDMNSYYGKSVAWAVDRGIIKGYENGKFGVGDMITREQVVTILYRYLGSPATGDESVLDSFTDADTTSYFAKEAMIWAVNNGIITGKDAETLAPTDTQSRAEIATVVMRMDNAGMFD